MSRGKQTRSLPRRRAPVLSADPPQALRKRAALPRWVTWAAYSTALVTLVGLGVIHGALTDRWGPSPDLVERGKRLHDLPNEIEGRWVATGRELDPIVERAAEITDYVFRSYRDRPTDANIDLLIVFGRKGPIATHTPEDCFPGAGLVQKGKSQVVRFDIGEDSSARSARFWRAEFQGSGGNATRVCWSWNAGRAWEAPESARVHFAKARALYKVYVVAVADKAAEPEQEAFIKAVIPQLDAVLFEEANP